MDTLHLSHHLELLQRSLRGDSGLVKIRGSRAKIENPNYTSCITTSYPRFLGIERTLIVSTVGGHRAKVFFVQVL